MKYLIVGRSKASQRVRNVFYCRNDRQGGDWSSNWDHAYRFRSGDLAAQEFEVHREQWNWRVWNFMILPEDIVQGLVVGEKFEGIARENDLSEHDD